MRHAIFSLNELVTAITAEFASLAEARKQNVSIELASQPPMVEADRQKLHLVLANLLSNAIKFTPVRWVILSTDSLSKVAL